MGEWTRNKTRGVIAILLAVAFLAGTFMLPAPAGLTQDDNDNGEDQMVLVVEPPTATVAPMEDQQYRAYISRDGGATLDEEVTDDCFWWVDDPAIGIPTATPGLFTGGDLGTTTVRAGYPAPAPDLPFTHFPTDWDFRLEGSAELIVEEPGEEIEFTFEVEPKTATIYVGETQQYRAYYSRSDVPGREDVTDECDWDLVDDIATATARGEYQGHTVGTSSLTATYVNEDVPADFVDDAELIVREREPDDEEPPETEDLPEGTMINRQPGYIVLTEPQNLGNPGPQFSMNYSTAKMDGHPDRYPRVFYWNARYEKWVALASYPQSPGVVNAINEGNYSGWFVVFGCIQPYFTDITSAWEWAEPSVNRMNGLGLVEGYPDPNDPDSLRRPAGVERTITRAELTAVVARILGLAPGEEHLYPTLRTLTPAQNDAILNAAYTDADQIPQWARRHIAAMTDANLVSGKGDGFAPNDRMTRIEAAVLISRALQDVPGFGDPADLSVYTDAGDIPSWAIGRVAEGTIRGYPDGTLRPNQPINRAESLALLLRLLRGLDW